MPGRVCNINRSDINDFTRIAGLSDYMAKKLIDYRNEHGPFTNWDDLMKVPGFDDSVIRKLKSECDLELKS